MKIAICEDNIEELKALEAMLSEAFAKMHIDIEQATFTQEADMLAAIEGGETWTLCFLDIYIQGANGVKLAEAIKAANPEAVIVFTTSSPDFLLDGFRLGAVHYLLKPISQNDVDEAVKRALKIVEQDERSIQLMVGRAPRTIQTASIIYAESQNHVTQICTSEGILRSYIRLDEVQEMLTESSFLRCHRSYLVNMAYVEQVLEKDFLMGNDTVVPIRRDGRSAVKQAYYDYCVRHTRRRL